ncbi:unnamed protein product, partial [Ectocarpus sp. 12 AP-2014]
MVIIGRAWRHCHTLRDPPENGSSISTTKASLGTWGPGLPSLLNMGVCELRVEASDGHCRRHVGQEIIKYTTSSASRFPFMRGCATQFFSIAKNAIQPATSVNNSQLFISP